MRTSYRQKILLAGLLGALALHGTDGFAQSPYNVQVIRPFFVPNALNDRGQAVGLTLNDEGYGQGAIWTQSSGGMVRLGQTYDAAADINNVGQVAGHRYLGPGMSQATIFSNGGFHDLGSLGGNTSYANAINDKGQVTGIASTSAGEPHAFLYTNGSMMDLGAPGGGQSRGNDINKQGQVVGSFSVGPGDNALEHAFLYSAGRMIDLGTFGGIGSMATSINDAGQIVGNVSAADGSTHGFFYDNGSASAIFGPAGVSVSPQWINANGDVVGNVFAAGMAPSAFLYSGGTFSSLNALLNTQEGWELYQADAIDSSGNIIGWGCRPHPMGGGALDCAGLFLSPVPEPAAWTFWTAGIALGLAARKKRRSSPGSCYKQ